MTASMMAAALIVVVTVILGEYTKTRGRLLLTALSLSVFCLLALAPAALANRPGLRWLGRVGLGAAGLGCLLLVAGLWATPNSDGYWKSVAVVSVGAACGSYLCLGLLSRGRRRPAVLIRWTALLATGLTLAMAAAGIIAGTKAAPFWWTVALVVIVQVAAGLVLLLVNPPSREDGGRRDSRGEDA